LVTARDEATYVWLGVILLVALVVTAFNPKARASLRGTMAAAGSWQVLTVFGAVVAWCALCVFIASAIKIHGMGRLWTPSLLKDTITIVIVSAIPAMFRAAQARRAIDVARPLIADAVGVTALFVFFVNLEPFPLWVELLIVPISAIVTFRAIRLEEIRQRRPYLLALLVVAAGTVVWVVVRLLADAPTLDWAEVFRSFLLSVWLPLLVLPFAWLAAFLMAYQLALVRIRSRQEHKSAPVALAVFVGLRFRIGLAARLTFTDQEIVHSTKFRDTLGAMRRFRAKDRAEQRTKKMRMRNLTRYAGVSGIDEHGAQKDRREFEQTKRALDWLAAIEQSDHAHDGLFWNDRADELLSLHGCGLEPPFDVTVETTPDRQQWRAWRKTISGWILGRAGRAGEDSWKEWYFAGPTAPIGWPGDPDWIERSEEFAAIAAPPDWAIADGTEDL